MSGPRHPRRSATPPLIDFSDSESDTTDGGRDNRHSGGRNDAKLPLSSESSSSSSTVDARPIWPSSDAPPQFTVGPRGGFKAIRLSPSLRSILQIIHKRGYPVYYGCSASMVESIKEAIREAQSTRAGMGRRQPTWDSYGPTPCQGRAIRSNSRVPGHHFQSNAHTRERGYVYAAGGRVTISSCRPPKLSSLASVLAEEEEEEEEKRRRGNLPSRKRKHTSSWSDDTAPHKKRRSGSMSSSRPWSDKIDDYLDHRIEAPAPFKGHAFAVIIENVADDVSLETIKTTLEDFGHVLACFELLGTSGPPATATVLALFRNEWSAFEAVRRANGAHADGRNLRAYVAETADAYEMLAGCRLA